MLTVLLMHMVRVSDGFMLLLVNVLESCSDVDSKIGVCERDATVGSRQPAKGRQQQRRRPSGHNCFPKHRVLFRTWTPAMANHS